MLDSIFNNNGSPNWICLFLLMLVSFLLGWFLKKSYRKELNDSIDENERLKNTSNKELDLNTNTSGGVRAIKTMERAGRAVDKPVLNFKSFGKASEDEKDDLKQISGVGPFIEEKLNSIGIFTFKQISKFSDKDIDAVTQLIEFFPGRIKRDDWKGQADKLMKENSSKKSDK